MKGRKHLNHEVEVVAGPFGPHQAKLICKKCQKWIMWLPKNYEELLNEKRKNTASPV